MKYLELDALESVNHLLSQLESNDSSHIVGRLEAYSCKPAGEDKKLYKEMFGIPPLSSSPDGNQQYTTDDEDRPLSKPGYKILYYLIATLNQSFPDYDFRNLGMEHFVSIESTKAVIEHVYTMLFNACFHHPVVEMTDLNRMLWDSINSSIQLDSCDIYSYVPDMDGDPFLESGCIWSFNYFFWNKRQKRILFFYCKCMNASVLDDASSISLALRSVTPMSSVTSHDGDSDRDDIISAPMGFTMAI